jgi:hypothetical protein
MQFVQAPKEVERKQAEEEAAEELKQTFEDPQSASVETLIDDDAPSGDGGGVADSDGGGGGSEDDSGDGRDSEE